MTLSLIVEKFNIYCLKILEIILSVFITRCLTSFNKIIISTHIKRPHTVDAQLYAQALGKCRFS